MTAQIRPAPIRKEFEVKAPIGRAFEAFFDNMHAWSPKSHSLSGGERGALVIEPRAGGRWYELDKDGVECDWGRVVAWNPPHNALLLWQIGSSFQYDPEVRTEIEMIFTDVGGGRTKVVFEHRKLELLGGDALATREMLDGEDGWGGSLDHYVSYVEGRTA
jgi:uncharacterized protein YndB with AHSA1/START domain